MTDTTRNDLDARKNANGWHVVDKTGGTWWPNDVASAEIESAEDPAFLAVEICSREPMRGIWHQ